jgi:F0F1-type ATP synthase membrane subunit c/vacuolar-type H+-ATPase subunit K
MTNELARLCLYLGAAVSVGLAGLSAGFITGQTAGAAMRAIGRQPSADALLLRTTIISLCVKETGAIFCLVVSLLLVFGGFTNGVVDYARGASLLAAGLAVGLGSFGPNLGAGITGADACEGVGRSPSHSLPITTNMLIGQAMTQTAAIYALVVSILLLYTVPAVGEDQSVATQIITSMAYIGAAISIGIGTFGSGLGSGLVTGLSCKWMSRQIVQKALWMRITIITSAIAQTTAIYALVISFLLILIF